METLTFLYVEDDKMSRDILEFILKDDLGHNIFMFEDTSNIMERIESLPYKPDMIFLDIHMQPYNGFEVLSILRQNMDYRHIPIIALTASVMNEEVSQLQSAGFDGCLAKPLNYNTFPEVLNRLLNGEVIWSIG